MPSRGKKRQAAMPEGDGQDPPQPQQQHDQSSSEAATSSAPSAASLGPRRSTRLTPSSRKQPSRKDQDARQAATSSPHDSERPTKMRRKKASLKESGDESRKQTDKNVASAMQGLEEMEETFRRDIKKRKMQLLESSIRTTQDKAVGTHSKQVIQETQIVKSSGTNSEIPDEDKPVKDLAGAKDGPRDAVFNEEADLHGDLVEGADKVGKRAPAVNSDFLPLPWRGRLGYACLNTYLRTAKPPVFSSRTCRIASIIEHRYPLANPTEPEHPTKNRPDKSQEPDVKRGQKWVEGLGLANAHDIIKMLRWNHKYGIRFMRLSSEMFPFASHDEYGYRLAPFASNVLAEAGKVATELGHRLTTHPGQFTQLGSPRKQVVTAAIRDLEYHDELLSLLKLPPQQDRDAVMIMHMGGTFAEAGGKPATLDRFRENYAKLSDSIKRRLVLENDDVAWSVHDLLPICEELNIPLVLDYHHHNIVFDSQHYREGTFDISQPEISARITATWTRKGIKQKMHYSEPCAGAVTPRDRRKHSARVATLPPCPPDADLMIEAKDKEQAVFELMRTFKLPGHANIADVVAHEREDQDRPAPRVKRAKKTSAKKGKAKSSSEGGEGNQEEGLDGQTTELDPTTGPLIVSPEDFGMGGPQGRVYWPVGFEAWLGPKKKERKATPGLAEAHPPVIDEE